MVSGKVNPETGMLEYLSLPETDRLVREKCPIHDIASVWAVEVLGTFLDRRELRPLIAASLRHFGGELPSPWNGRLCGTRHRMGIVSSAAQAFGRMPKLAG